VCVVAVARGIGIRLVGLRFGLALACDDDEAAEQIHHRLVLTFWIRLEHRNQISRKRGEERLRHVDVLVRWRVAAASTSNAKRTSIGITRNALRLAQDRSERRRNDLRVALRHEATERVDVGETIGLAVWSREIEEWRRKLSVGGERDLRKATSITSNEPLRRATRPERVVLMKKEHPRDLEIATRTIEPLERCVARLSGDGQSAGIRDRLCRAELLPHRREQIGDRTMRLAGLAIRDRSIGRLLLRFGWKREAERIGIGREKTKERVCKLDEPWIRERRPDSAHRNVVRAITTTRIELREGGLCIRRTIDLGHHTRERTREMRNRVVVVEIGHAAEHVGELGSQIRIACSAWLA
jgi:hypothetical protein